MFQRAEPDDVSQHGRAHLDHRLRPEQATPIPGLALAGDYTRQQSRATMEGAVVSGRRAAEHVLKRG